MLTRGDKPTSPVILQRLTDQLDRENTPVLIDKPDHFPRFGSSSDAKKLRQPSAARKCRVALDVHDVASRSQRPNLQAQILGCFQHGGPTGSLDGPCAMKLPDFELLPGTRLATSRFSPNWAKDGVRAAFRISALGQVRSPWANHQWGAVLSGSDCRGNKHRQLQAVQRNVPARSLEIWPEQPRVARLFER